MVSQYRQLYLDTRRALLHMDGPQAGNTARELLCAASGKTREALIAQRDLYASEAVCREVERLTQAYLQGTPLAYLLHTWDFYGMTLYVDENVLIPRDDTCAVAELAIHAALNLPQSPRILDLCTGSGCIGLAVARRVKDARVTLGDISKGALQVAKKNITLQALSGRVNALQVDALAPAPPFLGKFDLLVSNPPYVTDREMEELPDSVKNFEPHLALRGGADGLDFYRAIVKNFTRAIKPRGYICFEFGMGQEHSVAAVLEDAGFEVLEIKPDNQGINRAVIARNTREE